jgi:hypothetical protein
MKENIFKIAILFILSFMNSISSDYSMFISQSNIRDWKVGERTNLEVGINININEQEYVDSVFILKINHIFDYSLFYDKNDNSTVYYPTRNNIFLEGSIVYPFGWKIDPFITLSGQTQITDMYMYQGDRRIQTAKFWDPVISIQSSGFTFNIPLDSINSTSFSLATTLRQVRSRKFTQLADKPETVDIIENYRAEIGLSIINEMNIKLDENKSMFKSRLQIFSDYEDLTRWIYQHQIELTTKFLEFCSFSLTILLNYDELISKKLNYNQNMRFGLKVPFFD